MLTRFERHGSKIFLLLIYSHRRVRWLHLLFSDGRRETQHTAYRALEKEGVEIHLLTQRLWDHLLLIYTYYPANMEIMTPPIIQLLTQTLWDHLFLLSTQSHKCLLALSSSPSCTHLLFQLHLHPCSITHATQWRDGPMFWREGGKAEEADTILGLP